MSDSESPNSKSVDSVGSCTPKDVKIVPLEESSTIESERQQKEENNDPVVNDEVDSEINVLEGYQDILAILDKKEDLAKKCRVV